MADFYSYRKAIGDAEADRGQIRDVYRKMRKQGSRWMRITHVNDQHQPCEDDPHGFWIEGWLVRPKEEEPFDPPLTEANQC